MSYLLLAHGEAPLGGAPSSGGTGIWRLLPEAAQSDGVEQNFAVVVKGRGQSAGIAVRVVDLIEDFSIGQWAIGVRVLKKE